MEVRFCHECGKERAQNSKLCDQCGTEIVQIESGSERSTSTNVYTDIEKPKKKGKLWAIISILFGIFSLSLTAALNNIYDIVTGLIFLGLLMLCILIGLIAGYLGRKFKVLSTAGIGLNTLFLIGLIVRFSNNFPDMSYEYKLLLNDLKEGGQASTVLSPREKEALQAAPSHAIPEEKTAGVNDDSQETYNRTEENLSIESTSNYDNVYSEASAHASTSDKLYRIQAGVFSSKFNAMALENDIKENGIETAVVQKEGLYIVYVGAFSVKENADNRLAELQSFGFDGFMKYE